MAVRCDPIRVGNRGATAHSRLVTAGDSVTLSGVSEVTRMLDRAQQGDAKAAEELLPLVYDELRRLGAARMAEEVIGAAASTGRAGT